MKKWGGDNGERAEEIARSRKSFHLDIFQYEPDTPGTYLSGNQEGTRKI